MTSESKFYDPIRRLPQLKINRKISIIAVCFFISCIFWFLIAFSGVYDAHLRFPLKYQNIPDQKLIVNDLPKGLEVFVKTSGFKILAYQFGKHPDSIELDVSAALQQGKELSKGLVMVPSKVLINNFTQQLGNEYSINGFYPDSIAFSFSNKASKRVPVILDSQISFEKQYGTSAAITIVPDCVTVNGPAALIENLKNVNTSPLVMKGMKNTVITRVFLKKEKFITTNVDAINVTIPVEKFTEGSMKIPVHILNLKNGYSMKVFPDEVSVRYHVSLSNYNKISNGMFNAIIDASALPDKSKLQLKVNLIEHPQVVKVTSIEPDRIDYILHKE